jgi:pimeloyl-ACP methyl ester carboxylesterase
VRIADIRDRIIQRCPTDVGNRFLLANDRRTFLLYGGNGKPVVLLHGAGGGGILWEPVLPCLCSHFRTIAPDIIGFGESAKPRARYDRQFFADWLHRVLDRLDLGRVSLIGNSMGGAIALQYALDHPDRIDKLILVGSAGLGLKGFSPLVFLAMAAAVLLPSTATARHLARYLVARPDRLAEEEELAYLVAVARTAGARRQFLRGRGKAVRPFPVSRLRTLRRPVLLLWGQKDRILSVDNARLGLKAIDTATMRLIPGAGHVPYYDQPAEFCNHAIDFLQAF